MSNSAIGSHAREPTSHSQQSTSPEWRGERRLISPFRCRVWVQHSRPEEQLTEQACKSLRESIEKNGQHQPALGRPINDDPDCDVEIICGARRHAAALSLGCNLLVEVRAISDTQAYIAMYEENVERQDDCPYIQGQILRRALMSGTCRSQDDLTRSFRLSHSKVSRLLMVAQLPSAVVAAFQSPREIREGWGVELYQLWNEKGPESALTTRARAIIKTQPRPPAREVHKLLTTPIAQHRLNRRIPIRGSNGTILFREEEQTANLTFTVPKAGLSIEQRDALKQAMIRILDTNSGSATMTSGDQ